MPPSRGIGLLRRQKDRPHVRCTLTHAVCLLRGLSERLREKNRE